MCVCVCEGFSLSDCFSLWGTSIRSNGLLLFLPHGRGKVPTGDGFTDTPSWWNSRYSRTLLRPHPMRACRCCPLETTARSSGDFVGRERSCKIWTFPLTLSEWADLTWRRFSALRPKRTTPAVLSRHRQHHDRLSDPSWPLIQLSNIWDPASGRRFPAGHRLQTRLADGSSTPHSGGWVGRLLPYFLLSTTVSGGRGLAHSVRWWLLEAGCVQIERAHEKQAAAVQCARWFNWIKMQYFVIDSICCSTLGEELLTVLFAGDLKGFEHWETCTFPLCWTA